MLEEFEGVIQDGLTHFAQKLKTDRNLSVPQDSVVHEVTANTFHFIQSLTGKLF